MSKLQRDLAWAANAPNSSSKMVLLCLAEHADNKGVCWPSIERIMRMTGLSRSSVSRGISAAKKANLLSVSSKKMRNSYLLTLPPMGQSDTPDVSTSDNLCVNQTHSMGQSDTLIEPSVEPSCEPSVEKDSPKSEKPKLTLVGGKEKIPVATMKEIVGEKSWKNLPKSQKQTAVSVLIHIWREAMLSREPDGYLAAPTATQRGQLGHLIARVGQGGAETLLAAVVEHWDDFAYYVKGQGGNAPESPQIGFILVKIEDVITWKQDSKSDSVPLMSKAGGAPKGHTPEF